MKSIRMLVIRVAAVAAWLAGGAGSFAAETLDRGMFALPRGDGSVYLGWRFLASDPAGRLIGTRGR